MNEPMNTKMWTVDELNAFIAASQRAACCGAHEQTEDDIWGPEEVETSLGVPGQCSQAQTNCQSGLLRSSRPSAPPIITTGCHVFPLARVRTNDKFLFLREIGGPPCLKPFLDKMIADGNTSPHWGGTLVIDQPVTLRTPIQIPATFTLAGVGINGRGRIMFEGDFGDTPAITFQEVDPDKLFFFGKSAIRDIMIKGPSVANNMRGIKAGSVLYTDDKEFGFRKLGRLQFHRVHISGFGAYGIQGGLHTFTVLIDNCEIIGNGVNIQLIGQCNSWRIRDCIIVGATAWGVDVGAEIDIPGSPLPDPQLGSFSDLLISGCRFADNKPGAIRVQPGHNKHPELYEGLGGLRGNTSTGVFVFGNHFERNNGVAVRIVGALVKMGPKDPDPGKVVLVSSLMGSRIISNFFEKGESVDSDQEDLTGDAPDPLWTQIGFNVSRIEDSILNTLRAQRMTP